MATKMKVQARSTLPSSINELVRVMPPMAIRDDVQHHNTVEMIDRLMRIEKLSRDQADYLETLVELVETYEARCHAIDLAKLGGLRMLKHILQQSDLSASDLARLLNMHPSMGSKILNGDRQLTWDHAKILAAQFKVNPALFMET